MSYHKVILDKLFPYAPYLNIRVGLEILVENGQDPMEAFEDAWQKIHDFRNKHIQAELSHQYEPSIEKIPDRQVDRLVDETLESWVSEINLCKNEKELRSWETMTKTYPVLKQAFLKKLKQINHV